MKRWVSQLFLPFLVLLLLVASMTVAAYRVPRSPPPPIYRVLNSRAATMGVREFLRLAAVNLNTADRDALMEIPGIGEVLSGRIIAYREENGAFATLEELDKVKGIGKQTVRVLGEYAYVE